MQTDTHGIGDGSRWRKLADQVLDGTPLDRDQLLGALRCPAPEVPLLLAEAYRVRHAHFGRSVQLHLLVNAKSGLCPEDCNYCSQSSVSEAPIEKYRWLDTNALLDGARKAHAEGARTYCIVASGRGPSDAEVEHLSTTVRAIKSELPLSICCSVGLVAPEQAKRLKAAGVDKLNHNLNTSERYYAEICETHTYGDRLDTLKAAREAGLQLCSGGIAGMGETDEDLADMALYLRELGAESVPMNFLHNIDGTPLARREELNPMKCLAILAAFRLALPDRELRIAGGRELHLRSMQSMGLLAANSIFLGDYLTTSGQAMEADKAMIADMGFTIVQAKFEERAAQA